MKLPVLLLVLASFAKSTPVKVEDGKIGQRDEPQLPVVDLGYEIHQASSYNVSSSFGGKSIESPKPLKNAQGYRSLL
jgi:hypothetical protein